MHEVRILWGLDPEPGDEPITYAFASLELLNAFLAGVDAAVGWLDHVQLDPGEEYCFACREVTQGRCHTCDPDDPEDTVVE